MKSASCTRRAKGGLRVVRGQFSTSWPPLCFLRTLADYPTFYFARAQGAMSSCPPSPLDGPNTARGPNKKKPHLHPLITYHHPLFRALIFRRPSLQRAIFPGFFFLLPFTETDVLAPPGFPLLLRTLGFSLSAVRPECPFLC